MQNRKKKNTHTDLQNSLLDSVGEGEGGMNWKILIYICKSLCKYTIGTMYNIGN